MSRRYIVIASPTKRDPIYLIYDTLNQVSIESGYGCEKWAQRQADVLEEKWKYGKDKSNSQANSRRWRR